MTLADLDRVVAHATPSLAPVVVDGKGWYVMVHPGTEHAEHIVSGQWGEWYAVPADGERRKLTENEQATLTLLIRQREAQTQET